MRAFIRVLAAACAVAAVGAVTTPAAAGGSFIDDDGNTHESAVEAIVADGITLGCGHLTYCPTEPVTRGQMASFLARAFDLPPATQDYFPDDAGTHQDNINRIAAAGITAGFDDGSFRPDAGVPRAQMATFLARALGLSPGKGSSFTDVSGIHAPNIYAVAAANITLGCTPEGAMFCPGDAVRRDQMASFLARALDLPLLPVPGVVYDTDLERCVIDTTIERSVAQGVEGIEYPPQVEIAREDAEGMADLGVDWADVPHDPRFLTDQILAEYGIDGGFSSVEGTVQALNADCQTLVDRIALATDQTEGRYFVAAGVVVDPSTQWRFTTIYTILIVES